MFLTALLFLYEPLQTITKNMKSLLLLTLLLGINNLFSQSITETKGYNADGIPILTKTYYYEEKGGPIWKIENYINNKLEGESKLYWSDGKLKGIENYFNGKPEGKWQYYHGNGKLWEEVTFLNHKQKGDRKTFYDSGKLKQILTENSVLKKYYESEQIKETGQFNKQHNPIGEWKEYYENGQILSEKCFIEGETNGISKKYYINGTLKEEISWDKGVIEGIYIEYYENGEINFKGKCVNGEREGRWEMFYKNGKLKDVSNWESGKLIGERIRYDINGKTK